MFASSPTNIDEGPSGLDTWLKRACASSSQVEWHLVHRGASLVVLPSQRLVKVEKEARQKTVEGGKGRGWLPKLVTEEKEARQKTVEGGKGRGWLPKLVTEVSAAIDDLEAGKGKGVTVVFGQLVRDEIVRRNTGGGQRSVAERERWFEWLDPEELSHLLGAWMHEAQVVSTRLDMNRRPSLTFHPTNDEFDLALQASNPAVVTWLLKRLAVARGASTFKKAS